MTVVIFYQISSVVTSRFSILLSSQKENPTIGKKIFKLLLLYLPLHLDVTKICSKKMNKKKEGNQRQLFAPPPFNHGSVYLDTKQKRKRRNEKCP